jgi:hypothetical protein
MLSKGKFYWGTTRNAVVAFGNMFNQIMIDRRDEAGKVVQTIKVPISYAPREKFLAKIDQYRGDNGEQNFQVVLPRMSFELIGLDYDPARKLNPVQQNRVVNSNGTLSTQYVDVPYNATMSLYIYAKNSDDALQIVEQILPYFTPDFNLTANAVPELDLKHDIPILLQSVMQDDQYEGNFEYRRAIIWTLTFTMKLRYYGPSNKSGLIRRVIANTFQDPELQTQIQRYTVTPDPYDAEPTDDYGYIENFEDF